MKSRLSATAATYLAFDGLLVLLGAYVSTRPPAESARAIWAVAFVVLGVLRVAFGIIDRKRADSAADQARAGIGHLVTAATTTEGTLGDLRKLAHRNSTYDSRRMLALLGRGEQLRRDICSFLIERERGRPTLGQAPDHVDDLEAFVPAFAEYLTHQDDTCKQFADLFGSDLREFVADLRREGWYSKQVEIELAALLSSSAGSDFDTFGAAFDRVLQQLRDDTRVG